MDIKVLGSGCKNCITLENNVKQALEELGISARVEKVSDLKEIVGYGVMRTPGLVVDGKVVLSGRVPSIDEIKKILTK